MSPGRLILITVVASLSLAAILALAMSGGGSSRASSSVVEVEDECEPATFNTVGLALFGIPDLCLSDFNGDVSLGRMLDALIEGGHGAWSFDPDSIEIEEGETLTATNVGGEFHTFTDVTATGFGGGCIPELNLPLGLTPLPQCADGNTNGTPDAFETSGLTPGGTPGDTLTVTGLGEGTHLFECLIHPWMRTAVEVEPD